MVDKNKYCEYIGRSAVRSLLFEVAATPKPGLVDRNNSGAHRDMDFYSFMSSCAALGPFFYKFAEIGVNFISKDYKNLLAQIRPIGIEAEKRMFEATNGINTHKGLIFSLGIICAAAGSCYSEKIDTKISTEEICRKVSLITQGIKEKELGQASNKQYLTYGEILYLKYGITGIRGEVENGFETVRKNSLPIMIKLLDSEGINIDEALVQVLLNLIAYTEDTNILGRHDIKTAEYAKKTAEKALKLGGVFTEKGKEFIRKMDEDFIEKNISPGGSADLLAVTLMFYFLEKYNI